MLSVHNPYGVVIPAHELMKRPTKICRRFMHDLIRNRVEPLMRSEENIVPVLIEYLPLSWSSTDVRLFIASYCSVDVKDEEVTREDGCGFIVRVSKPLLGQIKESLWQIRISMRVYGEAKYAPVEYLGGMQYAGTNFVSVKELDESGAWRWKVDELYGVVDLSGGPRAELVTQTS